jgi:hypothetical protein
MFGTPKEATSLFLRTVALFFFLVLHFLIAFQIDPKIK